MQNPWFPFPEVTLDPEIRVFCFAHAGGNASLYRDWRGTADLVEFYPVQLPGHGTRLGEPPLTSLQALVDGFAEAAAPLLDRPFALFGHSFGAWLAYAATQQIRTNYGQAARHLFVSGNVPPPKAPVEHPKLLQTDAEAAEYLLKLGGTAAELINHKDLFSLLIPLFKADINLLRVYHDDIAGKLACPITAYLGDSDPLHDKGFINLWSDYTCNNFDYHIFPGNHFYLENLSSELPVIIASSLA